MAGIGGGGGRGTLDVALSGFFASVSTYDVKSRAEVSRNLRTHIEADIRDMTSDQSARYLDKIVGRVLDLLNSAEVNATLGGIAVIDELIDLPCESNETMIIRFANAFRIIFQSGSHKLVLQRASRSLGHLAKAGGALTVDIVDFQVKQSLEWLQGSGDYCVKRRLAAVLVLKELAENTPTLFNIYVDRFLDSIWVAVRDNRLAVRQGAVAAMHACLLRIRNRVTRWKMDCYLKIFSAAQRDLTDKNAPVHAVHGSLLTMGELLSNTGDYLLSRFEQIVDLIVAFCSSRNPLVSCTVVTLLAQLSALSPDAFAEKYLDGALAFILTMTQYSGTFIAIGDIALAVRDKLEPHLDNITNVIHTALMSANAAAQRNKGRGKKKRNAFELCDEALSCIGKLAQAHGAHIFAHMHRLLPAIFAIPLTPALVVALTHLSNQLPDLKLPIRERLLETISQILRDPHHAYGAARGAASSSSVADGNQVAEVALYGPYNTSAFRAWSEMDTASRKQDSDSAGGRADEGARVDAGSGGTGDTNGPLLSPSSGGNSSPFGSLFVAMNSRSARHKHVSPAATSSSLDEVSKPYVRLALRTLGTFGFEGRRLLAILFDQVAAYLDSSDETVREAAVLTCSHLLASLAERYSNDFHTSSLVFDMTFKVVRVGVADTSSAVRLAVLSSLDERLDTFLAQPEILRALFVSVNDEDYEVREHVISLLGRLNSLNPALIMPQLRKLLVQFLRELSEISDFYERGKDETSRLLGHLIAATPHLVRPYVSSILDVLVPKLTMYVRSKAATQAVAEAGGGVGAASSSITVATSGISLALTPILNMNDASSISAPVCVPSSILETIGKLSEVCGVDMLEYLDRLLPLILTMLQDEVSSVRHSIALRTFRQLVASPGYVMRPYVEYPPLLPTVLGMLGGDTSLRVEVLKLLGVIGALDPQRFKLMQRTNSSSPQDAAGRHVRKARSEGGALADESRVSGADSGVKGGEKRHDSNTSGKFGNDDEAASVAVNSLNMIVSEEEYYPAVAIRALMNLLQDTTLTQYHSMVVKAVMFIFRSLGLKSVAYLPLIIPVLLKQARLFDESLMFMFLIQLRVVVSIVRGHICAYLDGIMELVLQFWSDKALIAPILALLEEISLADPDNFRVHLAEVVPNLATALSGRMGDRADKMGHTRLLLHALCIIGKNGGLLGYTHVVVPVLIRLAEDVEEHINVRCDALRALASLARTHDVSDLAVRIVHPLARILGGSSSSLFMPAVGAMSTSSIGSAQAVAISAGLAEKDRLALEPHVLTVFCLLIAQLGFAYAVFEPVVKKVLDFRSVSMKQRTGEQATKPSPQETFYWHMVKRMYARMAESELSCRVNGLRSLNSSNGASVAAISGGKFSNSLFLFDDDRTPLNVVKRSGPMGIRQYSDEGRTTSYKGKWQNAANVSRSGAVGDGVAMSAMYLQGFGGMDDWVTKEGAFGPDSHFGTAWAKGPAGVGAKTSGGGSSGGGGVVGDGSSVAIDDIFDINVLMRDDERDSPRVDSDIPGAAAVAEGRMMGTTKKLYVSQENLMKTWLSRQQSTHDDWLVWMRGFSIELLKESPSSALRACSALAQKYPPLAIELFNASFLSCWNELFDKYQDSLVKSLDTVYRSANVPDEIVVMILGLSEFMERNGQQLSLDLFSLGDMAERVRAESQALYYKERKFHTTPDMNVVEALISINNKLQQPDAARGILSYAQAHIAEAGIKESWYENLERWEDALCVYERKQLDDPQSTNLTLGRMRCLYALGQWERLERLGDALWDRTSSLLVRKQIAPLAANAACSLRKWDKLEKYSSCLGEEMTGVDGTFFQAVHAVHVGEFELARDFIDRSYHLLNMDVTKVVQESYSRAYHTIVKAQLLMELNEVIAYKTSRSNADRKLIRRVWKERLAGCQWSVDVWQQVLTVRGLVLSPREDMITWLQFATLCRKKGRLNLSHAACTYLLRTSPEFYVANPHVPLPEHEPPRLLITMIKYLYKAGYRERAFSRLRELVTRDFFDSSGPVAKSRAGACGCDGLSLLRLKARCYVRLGLWRRELTEDFAVGRRGSCLSAREEHSDNNGGIGSGSNHAASVQAIRDVLGYFKASIECDDKLQKAWHEWAAMNLGIVTRYAAQYPALDAHQHVIPAISGFVKSISLRSAVSTSRQDVLRFMGLWFTYGQHPDVKAAVMEGIDTISVDTWLRVIPQLIARIDARETEVRKLLHLLIGKIGRAHPQALLYSLTVSSKSEKESRGEVSMTLMHNMREHSAVLVEQALLVSRELVRVAILWPEMWREAIEDASRLWFGQKNAKAMIATLKPLHALMRRGAETKHEIKFHRTYGRDLQQAEVWCDKYLVDKDDVYMRQAWDVYSDVFSKLAKQTGPGSMKKLNLNDVSLRLLEARDLAIAVPGSYRAGEPVVCIYEFVALLHIIESKQHPRRMTILGNNGGTFQFLLKGHEDMRQDERVMQLFGLVNDLLASNVGTALVDLNIHRYSVVPLSPNSGLIEWVPHTDTLHALIKGYRSAHNMLLNAEQRLMVKAGPDYQHLTCMQKVEVFEYALDVTQGRDIAHMMWLKSPSADVWLDRRTNYTRSLAVMSMVGYVLGLGDRHPCNLMLERNTGKIVHIDFGDCFEVAMMREKYPEKVPFRLTRMLVNAMEVCGINGTFRSTCQLVMQVLRSNRNSVMALLEAFVYDPLVNWKLTKRRRKKFGSNDRNPRIQMGPGIVSGSGRGALGGSSMLPNGAKGAGGEGVGVPPGDNGGVDALPAAGGGDAAAGVQLASNSFTIATHGDDMVGGLNVTALSVIKRVEAKLLGRDFEGGDSAQAATHKTALDVKEQVLRLCEEAMSHENLARMYIGWCSFW